MGFNGIYDGYPLANVYITNWKIHPFFMGQSTISMAIFNRKLLVYQRVNVPFWGFWTSPWNMCWRLYPKKELGDVYFGHLPTPVKQTLDLAMEHRSFFPETLGIQEDFIRKSEDILPSFHDEYPLVNQHGYWTWPFIVSFPIKNGDFP